MRSSFIAALVAALGAGLLADTADAARTRGNGLASSSNGNSISRAYYAYLSEPGTVSRTTVRRSSSNGRRLATTYSSNYAYNNVNYTATDLGPPRGMSTRAAGSQSLRDNAKPAFARTRGVDGAEFFERINRNGAR